MSEPRWLALARTQLGVREWPGSGTNPVVAQYYADAAGSKQPDAVPWCAAFVGAMIRRSELKPWGNLMARGALNWGIKLQHPVPGCIVVFARGRPPSGHVAIVESVHPTSLTVIGGNQSDAVTRAIYARDRALGYRWPPGAPPPGAPSAVAKKAVAYQAHEEVATGDMTPQQIMDKAKELYRSVDTTYSIGGAKKAVKEGITLMYYLAKLHLQPSVGSIQPKKGRAKRAKK